VLLDVGVCYTNWVRVVLYTDKPAVGKQRLESLQNKTLFAPQIDYRPTLRNGKMIDELRSKIEPPSIVLKASVPIFTLSVVIVLIELPCHKFILDATICYFAAALVCMKVADIKLNRGKFIS
jgi:hypothetical protein